MGFSSHNEEAHIALTNQQAILPEEEIFDQVRDLQPRRKDGSISIAGALNWFWARSERQPVVTERCVGHEPVGPGRGPYMTGLQPVTQTITEWTTVPIEDWPMRRRLRFGRNVGLVATAIVSVFWGVWWLITGSVPVTTAIPWTPEVSFNLPFALSRLWDIPAVFVWAFGLAIVGSYWPQLRSNRNKDVVTGLVYRLDFGLGVGLGYGLVYGLVVGLGVGLAAGLAYGLAPFLPVALILIPLSVLLINFVLRRSRSRQASAAIAS